MFLPFWLYFFSINVSMLALSLLRDMPRCLFTRKMKLIHRITMKGWAIRVRIALALEWWKVGPGAQNRWRICISISLADLIFHRLVSEILQRLSSNLTPRIETCNELKRSQRRPRWSLLETKWYLLLCLEPGSPGYLNATSVGFHNFLLFQDHNTTVCTWETLMLARELVEIKHK